MDDIRFEFLITDDGSPSLRMESASQPREAMHHTGGALSESIYIYFKAFERAQETGGVRSALSVGLGLAYNEFLLLAGWLRNEGVEHTFLHSFESEPRLRQAFLTWLIERENQVIQGIPMGQIYDTVVTHVGQHFRIPATELKLALRSMYYDNRFILSETLTEKTTFPAVYDVILFDAFSHKATPELWSEAFLTDFLARCASSRCVFATYAATGSLRRALKANGFEIDRRQGFNGKRESTLAWKTVQG